jgi:hypothetical protein
MSQEVFHPSKPRQLITIAVCKAVSQSDFAIRTSDFNETVQTQQETSKAYATVVKCSYQITEVIWECSSQSVHRLDMKGKGKNPNGTLDSLLPRTLRTHCRP